MIIKIKTLHTTVFKGINTKIWMSQICGGTLQKKHNLSDEVWFTFFWLPLLSSSLFFSIRQKAWLALRGLLWKRSLLKVRWNEDWCQIQLIEEGVEVLFVWLGWSMIYNFFFKEKKSSLKPPLTERRISLHVDVSLNAMTVVIKVHRSSFPDTIISRAPLRSCFHGPH